MFRAQNRMSNPMMGMQQQMYQTPGYQGNNMMADGQRQYNN